MADPNRQLFERFVQLLRPLLDELVFVGGCARRYIALEIGELLDDRVFVECLSGFLLPDQASQARLQSLEKRLKAIAVL